MPGTTIRTGSVWCLRKRGVTVDVVEADDYNKPEDLAEVNPYNSLPTLLDRDLALYEVNVIIEYLDERFSASAPVAGLSRAARPVPLVDLPNREGVEQ